MKYLLLSLLTTISIFAYDNEYELYEKSPNEGALGGIIILAILAMWIKHKFETKA